MDFRKLAFVDIETTGSSATADRVIEVGVLKVENGKLVETYSSLIDPECAISPWITSITGIKQKDVDGAPTFHQIAEELHALLADSTFVAHNVRFDYGFLKSEFARHSIEFSRPHFCTVKLSRALFPRAKRHNLDSIIKRHKILCENRHRALDDARVLWDFFQKIHEKIKPEKIDAALKLVSRRASWPSYLPKDQMESLPQGPGVYVFYGDNDLPLYVGKSVNIKSRVLSHFADDLHSVKEMQIAQQVKRIETTSTHGELGALIKEADMIKKLMPLYNKMLRKAEHVSTLKSYTDTNGYLQIKIDNTNENEIMPDDIPNIVGLFRTKRQAERELMRIHEEHGLCKKFLNLEKTKRACFGYQLKKCRGACLGEEPANLYNLRFEIAFNKLRFRKWPYEEPIVIVEGNDRFLVDKWCYLGKVDNEGLGLVARDTRFDLDVYKILKNFLLNPRNQNKIQFFRQEVKIT
jgi:DNA polymerase III subunit epsilon